MVPELSLRWTGTILVDGSVTPGFNAAISLSFHVVIFESKIFAGTVGESVSFSTPGRL